MASEAAPQTQDTKFHDPKRKHSTQRQQPWHFNGSSGNMRHRLRQLGRVKPLGGVGTWIHGWVRGSDSLEKETHPFQKKGRLPHKNPPISHKHLTALEKFAN